MATAHPPQQGVYTGGRRPDVLPYVPRDVRSVLDVGCGQGGFGLDLRTRLAPGAQLVGIEPVPEQAETSRELGCYDEVREGYFPDVAVPGERFDLVVFNDVLEHVLDPWTMLLDVHRHLAPDGRVLASIPNIQFAPVVLALLRGRWDYTDTGVLDRTHVRFFTRATMLELFHKTGYEVLLCEGINNVADVHDRWFRGRLVRARHLLGPSQWMQFVVLAARYATPSGASLTSTSG